MKRFLKNRNVRFWLSLVISFSLPIWFGWRRYRHQNLNHQLLNAIRREDTQAALAALENGADGNALEHSQKGNIWQNFWNNLSGHSSVSYDDPTALILALRRKDNQGVSGPEVYPKEDTNLINALILHGAQVNEYDISGFMPLTYAIEGGKNATSRLLIQKGAIVNQAGGNNVLNSAATLPEIDADIVEMMLLRGADPNLKDTADQPALARAISSTQPDKVRVLLRYHANPNVRIYNGASALSSARANAKDPKMHEIMQMLEKAGAVK